MTQEYLFTRIKRRCDEARVLANGTGRPMVFTITKDNLHHVFTIGVKAILGHEIVFVNSEPKEKIEALVLEIVKHLQGNVDMSTWSKDKSIQVVFSDNTRWLFKEISYDKVNLSLSGTVAAVYGTHTPLRQLFKPGPNGRLPGESGYLDMELKNINYAE